MTTQKIYSSGNGLQEYELILCCNAVNVLAGRSSVWGRHYGGVQPRPACRTEAPISPATLTLGCSWLTEALQELHLADVVWPKVTPSLQQEMVTGWGGSTGRLPSSLNGDPAPKLTLGLTEASLSRSCTRFNFCQIYFPGPLGVLPLRAISHNATPPPCRPPSKHIATSAAPFGESKLRHTPNIRSDRYCQLNPWASLDHERGGFLGNFILATLELKLS